DRPRPAAALPTLRDRQAVHRLVYHARTVQRVSSQVRAGTRILSRFFLYQLRSDGGADHGALLCTPLRSRLDEPAADVSTGSGGRGVSAVFVPLRPSLVAG